MSFDAAQQRAKHKVLQILINLLSNAKHALNHPDAGREKRITVRLERPGPGRLVFEVTDTGMGISADDLGRISAASQGRGQGSTFRLEVPCGTESGVEAAAE